MQAYGQTLSLQFLYLYLYYNFCTLVVLHISFLLGERSENWQRFFYSLRLFVFLFISYVFITSMPYRVYNISYMTVMITRGYFFCFVCPSIVVPPFHHIGNFLNFLFFSFQNQILKDTQYKVAFKDTLDKRVRWIFILLRFYLLRRFYLLIKVPIYNYWFTPSASSS